MKRSGFIKRYTPLSKPTKRMRAVNPEAKAKRKARRPRLKQSVRKEALARAGNQCTYSAAFPTLLNPDYAHVIRCTETESLHVHETRYPAEVDDCVVLCKWHHMRLESQLRPWNVGRLGR